MRTEEERIEILNHTLLAVLHVEPISVPGPAKRVFLCVQARFLRLKRSSTTEATPLLRDLFSKI